MNKPIKDRAAITDHVASYMQANCPSWGLDRLLQHPIASMRMGLDVAAKSARITPAAAKRISRQLAAIEVQSPAIVDAVQDVLRAAMASRKRGDLKRDKV